jgi:hypothetical protein
MYVAKYWVLYTKELAPYKWSFLWYEALWGKVWDKLYLEEKKAAENGEPPKPFDEKELLISLLWKQSWGKLKPKRRSKFYKEFKWKIAWWFEDENNDWYKDATDKRSIKEINEWWMGEVYGWTIPNWLAWARRAVEKWGSLKDMNKIYFTLIYSWALYDAPSNVLEKQLKTDWQKWNSMIFAWLGSTLWGQKLLNKTVRDLAIEIEKTKPEKYRWISKLANEIYIKASDPSVKHWKKIELAEKLWDNYWDVLSRSLFMVDDDKVEYAETDKIIYFWKESKFKDYYSTIKEMTGESYVYAKDFMEDAVWASWAADTNIFKVLEDHFGIDQSLTFRNKWVVKIVWPKILSWFKTAWSKIEANPSLENNYRKYLNSKLREIVAWILSWAWKDRVKALDTVDPVWYDLASYGIILSSFAWIPIKQILDWNVKNDVFEKAVDNIIKWKTSEVSILGNSNVFDDENDLSEATSDTIDEIKDVTYKITPEKEDD